jgi:acetolactate synthase-1/3 small subunit
VERELVLIRVNAEPQHRAEILRTADIFRARVVDVTPVSFVLEATGDDGKLEALIELLRPIGIQEVVRTGKIAITRGPKSRVKRAPSSRPRVSEDPRVVGFAD